MHEEEMTVIQFRPQKSKYTPAMIADEKDPTEIAWSHSLLLLIQVIRVVLNHCAMQPNVHRWTLHTSEALVVTTLCFSITISGCMLL